MLQKASGFDVGLGGGGVDFLISISEVGLQSLE